ncbi:MAG: hypothetical protein PWQ70_2001 [Clostridiales bacterium]|nr:hypothetical protein [Clostridiales bacterium]
MPGTYPQEPSPDLYLFNSRTVPEFCNVLALELVQNIVMSHINQYDHPFNFVVPYNTDIHVDTAFEKVISTLYPLGSQ